LRGEVAAPFARRVRDSPRVGFAETAPSRSIREFAERNFNVQRTARHLDLHTPTPSNFRLNRIRDPTGIDPRSYAELSLLLTTARMPRAGPVGR
jgi:sugar diacid utilization regulator